MILSFYLFIHSFIYINTPLGEMIPGEMQLSITFHIFFFFFFFFLKIYLFVIKIYIFVYFLLTLFILKQKGLFFKNI